MATRAEIGSLTEQVQELSGELHRELVDGDADFGRMSELSGELSRRAESLASTFEQVDGLLAAQLGNGGASGDD